MQTWARARSQPQRVVQRAKIILLAAEGVESQTIAHRVGTSRPTVQLWRERFLALRTAGLEKDAPRPGRIPAISDLKRAAMVEATLHSQPPHATHWSTRSMAKGQGVSEATVRRIWKQHGLRPHHIATFKVSRDPMEPFSFRRAFARRYVLQPFQGRHAESLIVIAYSLDSSLVLLFADTVTYCCQARPSRADIVWPTAKAVGKGGTSRAEPAAAGGIALRKRSVAPGAFLSARLYPSAIRAGPHYAGPNGPRWSAHLIGLVPPNRALKPYDSCPPSRSTPTSPRPDWPVATGISSPLSTS